VSPAAATRKDIGVPGKEKRAVVSRVNRKKTFLSKYGGGALWGEKGGVNIYGERSNVLSEKEVERGRGGLTTGKH